MERLEEFWESRFREYACLIIGAISVALSFIFEPAAIAAIIVCGLPVAVEAIEGLVKRFDIKAGVLVTIAIIAAAATGEFMAAGEVAFIMAVGEFLEELSERKAHSGIEKLLSLRPPRARIERDGTETEIHPDELVTGDITIINEGETCPADGIVTSGHADLDTSAITGEAYPVAVGDGSSVYAGAVIKNGALRVKVTAAGKDSSIERMIRLVKSSGADKAKVVRLADRWATYITIAALVTALAVLVFKGSLQDAISVLIVFCPCSLIIATPAAVMTAIANAGRNGALIRDGGALERLAETDTVFLDKTGTVTEAKLAVSEIYGGDENTLALLCAAEKKAAHPAAAAIIAYYKEKYGKEPSDADEFESFPGYGISAMVNGIKILAGNEELLKREGVDTSSLANSKEKAAENGDATIFVAIDGKATMLVALRDRPRARSGESIAKLKNIGLSVELLSGDNTAAVAAAAKASGIDKFAGHKTPEGKLEYIKAAEMNGAKVCMVGDGINDAPALKAARVGVSMGGVGSDIAIEASDIALTGDSIELLPRLFLLARRARVIININIIASVTINVVGVALAIAGYMPPVIGALLHNGGSLIVLANAMMLLKYK